MNSIWLILLLLCCCNGDDGCGRERGDCVNDRDGGCNRCFSRDRDWNRDRDRDRDCGCERDMRSNPFSPLNRMDCDDTDFSGFCGNNGPCGCEENHD